MGLFDVGVLLGVAEGPRVGRPEVGMAEGSAVGVLVLGKIVGDLVGSEVVGCADGTSVGVADVGDVVGLTVLGHESQRTGHEMRSPASVGQLFTVNCRQNGLSGSPLHWPVGILVGTPVGAAVGSADGNAVGLLDVGIAVGSVDGLPVGMLVVGLEEGTEVGGLERGACEGENVGTDDVGGADG